MCSTALNFGVLKVDTNPRNFLSSATTIDVAVMAQWLTKAQPPVAKRPAVLQLSRLAGCRHDGAGNGWVGLQTGDGRSLVREAKNPHDHQGFVVFRKHSRLGDTPRVENITPARVIDGDRDVGTKIVALRCKSSHWVRIEIELAIHV